MSTIIFTDGASRGNPGPGGWGAILVMNEKAVTELGGGEKETTNNRMELKAAIEALKEAPQDSSIELHSDSSYLVNGATKWLSGWKRNGWKTKAKDDVLNKDLWEGLDAVMSDMAASGIRIDWKYAGGHIGVAGNERCDEIATGFADGEEVKLYKGPLNGYDIPDILDISHDESMLAAKRSGSSRSRAKAYSYVSMVKGEVMTHRTWGECEKRVKGVPGARFKKALDAGDEAAIMAEFKSS